MNYELAKQLKDAGFELKPITYGTPLGNIVCPHAIPNFEVMCDEALRFPLLSELIEACGDEFSSLELLLPSDWVAKSGSFKREHKSGHLGKTPEEAVAHLWLALNKD